MQITKIKLTAFFENWNTSNLLPHELKFRSQTRALLLAHVDILYTYNLYKGSRCLDYLKSNLDYVSTTKASFSLYEELVTYAIIEINQDLLKEVGRSGLLAPHDLKVVCDAASELEIFKLEYFLNEEKSRVNIAFDCWDTSSFSQAQNNFVSQSKDLLFKHVDYFGMYNLHKKIKHIDNIHATLSRLLDEITKCDFKVYFDAVIETIVKINCMLLEETLRNPHLFSVDHLKTIKFTIYDLQSLIDNFKNNKDN